MNINKEQLEMGLEASVKTNCRPRAEHRQKRARWWFGQMRVLVNSAIDWKPAPPARPEQIYFPLN